MYAKNFEDTYDKILCYGISLLEALHGKNSTNDMQGYNYRKIIIRKRKIIRRIVLP